MRALVTGPRGFLGRHLVRELHDRGHEVVGVVRPSSPADLDGGPLEVLRADLRRPGPELSRGLQDVDVVFHLAASLGGNWRSVFEATVLATERLFEAIDRARWQGRFVHASSFAVYGLNQVPRGSLVDESTPLEPEPHRRDAYAWAKFLQERIVRERAASARLELAIVRPGTIYGRERQFQHQLGRQIGSGLLLLGGLTTMRLNYVENAASLIAECGEHPSAAGAVLNAVDPHPLRQWQYLRRWVRAQPGRTPIVPVPASLLGLAGRAVIRTGEHTESRVAPPRFLDPYLLTPALRDFLYGTDRPRRVLGWMPPVARDEALRRTFSP